MEPATRLLRVLGGVSMITLQSAAELFETLAKRGEPATVTLDPRTWRELAALLTSAERDEAEA
jgi:hypothetical protein